MKKRIEWLLQIEDGQGLMAYGMVILTAALVLISAVGLINGDLVEIYQMFATNMP